jgi:hypothetical protein
MVGTNKVGKLRYLPGFGSAWPNSCLALPVSSQQARWKSVEDSTTLGSVGKLGALSSKLH